LWGHPEGGVSTTCHRLGPEQQREVWKEAVETAPAGKIAAAPIAHATLGRLSFLAGFFRGAARGNKGKKEKTRWKEGEPPDLLRRRKELFFPMLIIT